MPGGSLGTIRGQIRLDVSNAIAGYAAVRAANASTVGNLNNSRNTMRAVGVASLAMGAGMLAAFGMAVNAAADFEKKLDYFGAVNNATAGEMEKVRAKALELGRTTAFSASQVADAFVEMGKAGVSAKDITDGMAEAMINLASAADIDLTEATNIVTSQIQAYGLSAKDAAHLTDVMAGAANASIVDVSDLGVSLKYVGGVAHALGISFDSTIDALSLLGKAGIKGSTAGTSLRQIMVSLAGGTNKAKKELEDLGIITADGSNKFFDAQGKAKSLSEVFQILQDHTANLTQKQRLMAFRTIFNNRALAAAQILTKEGAKGFAEMNDQISKTTAADVAAKRLDNLSGDIKKLKGNLDTLLIEGGTPFQNFLRGLVQGLTKLIQLFMRLPAGVQTGLFAFLLVGGVIFTLLGAISLMGSAFFGAMGTISMAGATFRLLGTVLWAATKATWALTVAALSNPYVLIAMAVIALIVGLVILYKKSEAFRNIMDTIGRALKTAFFATVEWFKGLPAFFSGMWDSITKFFSQGVDWVMKKWADMGEAIRAAPGQMLGVAARLGAGIINFVTAIPGQVAGFLSTAWDSFLGFMSELPGKIGYALGFALGTLTRWGIMAVMWAITTSQNIATSIVTFFAELPGRIGTWLTNLWNSFVAWGTQFTVDAIVFAVNTYNGIVDWFQKLPGRIWQFLVDMKDRAVKKFNDAVAAARKFGQDTITGIVSFFQQLPGRVATFAGNMASSARKKFDQAVAWAKTAGKNMLAGVIDNVMNMPGRVWDIVGRVVGAFQDMVRSAWNAAKDFAAGLWNGFKDGLGIHSPSYIEHALWAITDVADNETKRLKKQVKVMQGMSSGLQQIYDHAANNNAPLALAGLPALDPRELSLAHSMVPSKAQLGYGPSNASSAAASSSASDGSVNERAINVTINNPVAERASDSTARKLRQLSDMGAL